MGMYINSATGTLGITRNLYQTSVMNVNTMKRLSSGIRINSASDDAAGLSLSQKLTSVINGTNVAKNNTQTGIAMLNTADGALSVMTNSLERIRNLAVQSANGVYTAAERQMLQKEVSQLNSDIQQTYQGAKFNGKNVFTGDTTVEYSAAKTAGYDDMHIITSAADFVSKIQADSTGDFVLASDIDLSSLGTKTTSIIANFSGILEGNAHTISGFNINTGGAAVDNIGLFGVVSGTIQNLNINNFTVTATNSNYTGGLVGQVNGGTVTNCNADGTINAYMNGAMIVGYNNGGQVTYCSSKGLNTSNGWSSAGIVAWNNNGGLVSKSYSSATMINNGGNDDAAGIVGYNSNGSTVSECYFSGSVSAFVSVYANVGGIVACNDNSTVTNCFSTGNVTSTGGGSDKTGGVVGANWAGSTVTKSYSTGTVMGNDFVGGVVGSNAATVDNTNFYKNNMSTDAGASINANLSPAPTGTWNSTIWDMSGSTPVLKSTGSNLLAIFSSSTQIQVGADSKTTSKVGLNINFTLENLSFDVSNQGIAQATISDVDSLMSTLNGIRSNVGSSINKLSSIISIQDNRITNLSASNSNIKDADMAQESAQLIKSQIRQQSGASMLSSVQKLDKTLLMQIIG